MANLGDWRSTLWHRLPFAWQGRLQNNFIQRCIAGVFLTFFSLWVIWGGQNLFPLYVLSCTLLAAREWQRMTEPENWPNSVHYLYSATLLLAIMQQIFGPVAALVLLTILPLLLWLVAVQSGLRHPVWFAISMIYLALPAVALISILDHYTIGAAIITYFFGVVWATDTAAYVIGRRVGGMLLAPDVSPQKTWSGFFGGLVAGTIVGVVTGLILGADHLGWSFIVSLGLSAAAQGSDLAQSWMKRFFQIKDTGGLIPGHGGILDRIDSLMLSAPLFWLLQNWAGRPLPW